MIGGLVRFVLFRLVGARVLLALTVLGWLRRQLSGKRDAGQSATGPRNRTPSGRSRE